MLLDALAQGAVSTAPARVQALDLALRRWLTAEVSDDAFAGRAFVARQRDQILHRRLRGHGPIADGALGDLGQREDESKTAAHPAARAAQALCELVLLEAVVLHQRVEQPAVFQGAAAAGFVQAVGHDQRVCFAQLHAHGFGDVAAERAKRSNAEVAVHEHEARRRVRGGHDRQRALLAVSRKARAHARSAGGVANAKTGVPKLEFVQLHLHRREPTEGPSPQLSRLALGQGGLWRVCA